MKFEMPEIKVVNFEIADVITTSTGDGLGENQTPEF